MAAGVQRRLVSLAIILITLALAQLVTAQAQINFRDNGAFENCLGTAFDKWVQEQAELQVNDDLSAQTLDDRRVASWAGEQWKSASNLHKPEMQVQKTCSCDTCHSGDNTCLI